MTKEAIAYFKTAQKNRPGKIQDRVLLIYHPI